MLQTQIQKRIGSCRASKGFKIGFSTSYMIDFLTITCEKTNFSVLLRICLLRHKKSTLKYLRWFVAKGLMEHIKMDKRDEDNRSSYYLITVKGRMFLEMLT